MQSKLKFKLSCHGICTGLMKLGRLWFHSLEEVYRF